MRDQNQTSSITPTLIVLAAVALIAAAVYSVLRQQFGFTAVGAALPTLLCFAGLLAIQRIAQRAALVRALADDVARLEAELQELGPGGKALERASEDLAIAAHTLRGVDAPDLGLDLQPSQARRPARNLQDPLVAPAAERFGKRAKPTAPPSLADAELARIAVQAPEQVPVPALGPAIAAALEAGVTLRQPALRTAPTTSTPNPVAPPISSPDEAEKTAPAMSLELDAVAPRPSLSTVDPQLAEVLRRVAADGSVEIHLQPIVALADRKARLYDVFPRLRRADGTRVTPAEYWAPAHQLGVALVLERHVVLRASQILQRLSEKGRARNLFCRLSQSALADRALITSLVTSLQSKSELVEHIVVEVTARDYLQCNGPERDGMAELGRLGVRFALEGVDSLVVDCHRLAHDRINYLKLGPPALAAEHRIAGFDGMASLISDLRRSGIDVILDQVTDEGMTTLGLDCGIILGQGSLFGEARPVAAEYLGESQPAAAKLA